MRRSVEEATRMGDGSPPSYSRIIGLSKRLDKNMAHKLRHQDAMQ